MRGRGESQLVGALQLYSLGPLVSEKNDSWISGHHPL